MNVYHFQQREKELCVMRKEKYIKWQEKKEKEKKKSHEISIVWIRLFNVYFLLKSHEIY